MVSIGTLPRVQTVATVLIGSGEGTLTIDEPVEGSSRASTTRSSRSPPSAELRPVAP